MTLSTWSQTLNILGRHGDSIRVDSLTGSLRVKSTLVNQQGVKLALCTIYEAFKGVEFRNSSYETFKWVKDEPETTLIFFLAYDKKKRYETFKWIKDELEKTLIFFLACDKKDMKRSNGSKMNQKKTTFFPSLR
jgi:hypothetical protein